MSDEPPTPENPDPTSELPPPPETAEPVATEPVATDPVATDPVATEPDPEKTPWPGAAKGAVVVLVVVALLAGVLAVIGWTRDTDDGVPAEDLATAVQRADDAEAQVSQLEASLADVESDLEAAEVERDETAAALAEADTRIEELTGLTETLAETIVERDTTIEELNAALADLAEPFPVTINPDLPTADVDGQYSLALTEFRCFNLPQCGSPPALPNASLTRSGDQLILNVPGQFQISMFGSAGQLFGVSETQTLVPECGATPRPQTTTIAMHAGGGQVQLGGRVDLTSLGASVIVTAPAVDDCPAGEVWYGVRLTRVG